MIPSNIIIALRSLKGFGPKKLFKIFDELENLKISNHCNDFVDFFSENLKIEESLLREAWDYSNKVLDLSLEQNIKVISYFDPHYPSTLKKSTNPPILVFLKGNQELFGNNYKKVAIVGSRNATNRGLKVSFGVGRYLAKQDYVVVSGLAIGCDTEAHKGMITSSGKGIAVLAQGLQTISPKQNIKLADEIIGCGGALISEYDTGSSLYNFQLIERNRIISSLSNLIFVADTGLSGGTQQTIEYALKESKKLVCRHPREEEYLDKKVEGNLNLISQGHKGVKSLEELDDVLANLD